MVYHSLDFLMTWFRCCSLVGGAVRAGLKGVNGWSNDFLGLLHVVGYLPHIGVYGWGPCGVLLVSCLLVHLLCARGIMMTLPTSSLLQVLHVP